MSRCICCGGSFEETSGWQEYCCLGCAYEYYLKSFAKNKKVVARQSFRERLEDPKFSRRIRMDGTKAKPITFGTFEEREIVIEDGLEPRNVVRRVMNVGGELKVRPMTDAERKQVVHDRGRGSFGEDHHSGGEDNLPSQNEKYGRGWFKHD